MAILWLSLDAQYLTAAAASLLSADDNEYITIRKVSVCNNDTSNRTFTLYILPSGVSSVADNYKITNAKLVPTGETIVDKNIQGHILKPGESLYGLGSVASKLTIKITYDKKAQSSS